MGSPWKQATWDQELIKQFPDLILLSNMATVQLQKMQLNCTKSTVSYNLHVGEKDFHQR